MNIPKVTLIFSLVSGAFAAVSVQILAITFLPAEEYGLWAIIYLCYALSVSGLYSVGIDSIIRDNSNQTLGSNSVVFGFAFLLVPFWFILSAANQISPSSSILIASAVSINVWRTGLRYWDVHRGLLTKTIFSDSIQMILLLGITLAFRAMTSALDALLIAWLISGLISGLTSSTRRDYNLRAFSLHLKSRRKTITALWAESALLDVGSTLTSVVLIPLMSIREFGIFRGVASTSALSRMFIAPARPILSKWPRAQQASLPVFAMTLGVSLLLGASVALALRFVTKFELFSQSALFGVANFDVQSGLFTFGVTVSSIYYIFSRKLVDLRTIIKMRTIDLSLTFTMPLVGFFLGGVSFAIWGMAFASLIVAFIWYVGFILSLRKLDS